MKPRIIAFVDHEIGHRLLSRMVQDRDALPFDLVAVVTTEDNGTMWWPGVGHLCHEANIPLHRYTTPFAVTREYEHIDWYLLLSWKYVLSPDVIELPRRGTINLHYSLLPENRGVYPVNWAIIEGKDETGVTYHVVGEEIDTGPVLCRKTVPIRLSDTARTLQLRMDDAACELFDQVIAVVAAEREVEADEVVAGGTYRSRGEFEASNELDLEREYRAGDLLNLLRGKTFLPQSKNLYIVDPSTGKRIYLGLCLEPDD